MTSFQKNPALNLANPQTGTDRGLAVPTGAASWENSTALQSWLYDKRETEDINTSLTLDLVFSGMTGLQLPGGEVGWAVGLQGRMLENRDIVNSQFHNGQTPCMWPGQDPAAPGTPAYTAAPRTAPVRSCSSRPIRRNTRTSSSARSSPRCNCRSSTT